MLTTRNMTMIRWIKICEWVSGEKQMKEIMLMTRWANSKQQQDGWKQDNNDQSEENKPTWPE